MMITKIILFLGIIAGVISLALYWAYGIDYMKSKHPDYKGDDFLN
jgi:hypothetical protein